ncbi:MAG: hypothetical protein ABSA49_14015, partial [Rhizomicrobium sp.]
MRDLHVVSFFAESCPALAAFDPLAPAAYADAYFGLREGLERLFGREIDLVIEASLANPYFRRQVEAERQNSFVA